MTTWTDERMQQAIPLVRQHGAKKAAAILGASYDAMRAAFVKRRISMRKAETNKQAVARLYAARWPVEDITARLGISRKTVYFYAFQARREGRDVPRPVFVDGFERRIDYAAAARMGRQGKSQAEIAARFGVIKSAISHAFARMRADGIDCGPAGRWPERRA